MAVEFSENYISSITAEGGSRGEALKSQPLISVYMARKDLSTNKKAKIVEAINSLGGQDLTLGDLVTEDANRVIFLDNIIAEGQTSDVKAMIGDFKNLFAEIGVTAQGTTNPFRGILEKHVGQAKYEQAGFGTATSRLRPISIPPEVYQETKDIAASLMSDRDPEVKSAGGRMLLMMLGGYRPSDFKALNIENIDFETGVVTGLELKTDKGTKGIGVAYMPRPQLDIIRSIVGNRTSGLVFENPEKLDKIIREELKTSNLPKIRYLQESTRQVVEQPFTAYDFRRMQESTLQAAGFNSDNPIRKYLTWRPLSSKEASEGYMALQNQSAAIEAANALSFEPYVHLTEGNTIKLNDNTVLKTHGQFLTDVGVTQLSPFTKKYVASEAGRSRLPVNVLEKLEQVDDGVTYPQESIMTKATDVNPEAATEYLQTSKINRETRKTQAQINLLDKQAELAAKPAPPPKPTGKQVAKPEFEGAGQVSEKLSSKLEKYGIKLGIGALAGTSTLAALLDPAEAAVETALEVGARSMGVAAGPAAAVPMIVLGASEAGAGSDVPGDRSATQEELMAQVKQREADKQARQQRRATAEKAFGEGDSFLTMSP